MRRYSKTVKTDVRKRVNPPHRQNMAQISGELGICDTLEMEEGLAITGRGGAGIGERP